VSSTITAAVQADVDALVAENLGPEGLYRDRLKKQEAGKGWLLVHRLDAVEPPGGVIFLWLDDAEEDAVRTRLPGVPLIMHLKVHPGRRGFGIGTELMHEAERMAAALGRTEIALGVDPGNTNAIRLYQHLGYSEWPHGLVDTHQVEYRARCSVWSNGSGAATRWRRRYYNEKCLIFVKPLSTASLPGAPQSLAGAHGIPG
jgi:GNAT superfamily N-acetyltransferase